MRQDVSSVAVWGWTATGWSRGVADVVSGGWRNPAGRARQCVEQPACAAHTGTVMVGDHTQIRNTRWST